MKIEARTLTAQEMGSFAEVGAYAYNLTPARMGEYLDLVKQYPSFGVFADGKLGAAMIDRRFDLWVNGAPVKANGIGMVASAPETRRLGLVREMMAAHLRQLMDDGVVLSMLYPFAYSFYTRLGWAFSVRGLEIKIAPNQLARFGRRVGTVRRALYAEKGLIKVAEGETEAGLAAKLDAVYGEAVRGVNLCAVRTFEDWRTMFNTQRGRRHIVVWEDELGAVQGYVVYHVREDEFPADLAIREMFARTPEAWQGLCFYLSCHDSHIRNVVTVVPPEHPLLELVENPRIEQAKLSPGVMARAVDVGGLLSARGAAGRTAGECTLYVKDRLAPWNDGGYLLRSDGEDLSVERRDLEPGGADLSADVNGFSQLAVGYRGLEEMLLFGLVSGNRGPGLDFARRLFPVRPTRHLEYY